VGPGLVAYQVTVNDVRKAYSFAARDIFVIGFRSISSATAALAQLRGLPLHTAFPSRIWPPPAVLSGSINSWDRRRSAADFTIATFLMVFLSSRPLLETLLYRFDYVAVLRAIFAFQTVFSWTLGFYNNSERTEYCYFRQMVGLSVRHGSVTLVIVIQL